MSATDWYVCPVCKAKALKYIASWYGKVTLEEWEALLYYKDFWEKESENWKDDKEVEDAIDKIEERFPDFDRDEFSIDSSVHTVRYDSDSGLDDKGVLRMHETYSCQHCEFHVEVDKSWKQGKNREEGQEDDE
jgi:hypothetical protein